ncbi:MAG TPA: hypothetical protein VMA53_07185 [Stellaceae bacterium]|nr:hypothetical protein [Stellaceae bacterium]
MYTIYYERDGSDHRVPVVFAEKLPALENACEMLRLGFRVARIEGPGFSIGARALHEYRRATSARVRGQTLRLKKNRAMDEADEAMEAAGADAALRKA